MVQVSVHTAGTSDTARNVVVQLSACTASRGDTAGNVVVQLSACTAGGSEDARNEMVWICASESASLCVNQRSAVILLSVSSDGSAVSEGGGCPLTLAWLDHNTSQQRFPPCIVLCQRHNSQRWWRTVELAWDNDVICY